jgi:hypothetical protein
MSHVITARIQRGVDERDLVNDCMTGVYIGTGRNLHHRKLLSRGGEDTFANLVTLSGSGTTGTHGWVHANPEAATRIGFMVPSWAVPAEVPIFLADARGRKSWHRLSDGWPAGMLKLTTAEAESIMRRLGVWGGEPLF